jgi:hypothetical protein
MARGYLKGSQGVLPTSQLRVAHFGFLAPLPGPRLIVRGLWGCKVDRICENSMMAIGDEEEGVKQAAVADSCERSGRREESSRKETNPQAENKNTQTQETTHAPKSDAHDLATMRLNNSSSTGLAGRRQSPLVPGHVGSLVDRPCRPLTHRAPQQGHPGSRNVQVQVIEQSKSSAETYIESLQQSLQDQRQQEPEEDASVVVSDIAELKQKVDGLQAQVRIMGCMGPCGGLQSVSCGSKVAFVGQWECQLLMAQARRSTATHRSSGAGCVHADCSRHAGATQVPL